VPNEAMPEIYAQADLMLFPTLSESFGFVLAESMACGTPVAALSDRGSPDEIIQDGLNGILAKDEEELTNKILLLLRNPEQMKNMGKAARNKVVSNYSSNRTYDQLVVILNKLCR
jgi:glycosyltransferase involved in cell wall biosynthesis